MIQRYVPVLTLVIVVAATTLFQLKYAVVAAEREISRIEQEIEAERWRLRTLEADWAYLARSERLAEQARALGMAPLTLARVIEPADIGDHRQLAMSRRVLPAELPSGQAISFRVKPVVTFDLEGLRRHGDALGDGW